MNHLPWYLITGSGALVGYTTGVMLKRGHLTAAEFWGIAAALMALVWWGLDTFNADTAAHRAGTALFYIPTICTCAALSVRCWRQHRRPGWYGGQHERIDNP